MRDLVKPPAVARGDTVAIVSPAGAAAGRFPHRVERGCAYLRSLGLRTRLMPHACGVDGWVSAPAWLRAQDINDAFLDDEVAVVLATIGGNHSNQVLPFLDYDAIRSHPKVFQGYSDVTILMWALQQHARLVTFHGPALVPELGEFPRVLPYTDRHLREAWFGDKPISFEPATEWTDEFLDWGVKADLARPRALRPGSGWTTVREGVAEGPLQGGSLEAITWHLKGSSSWLDLTGAVLILETSEETHSAGQIDSYLTDLEQLGVFHAAVALVVARPYRLSRDADVIWQLVRARTAAAGIPVLANVDFGHADPMLTLPLGVRARVDCGAHVLELLEPATATRVPAQVSSRTTALRPTSV
jgi:muramoyltetrapeptide carboxypeptidase